MRLLLNIMAYIFVLYNEHLKIGYHEIRTLISQNIRCQDTIVMCDSSPQVLENIESMSSRLVFTKYIIDTDITSPSDIYKYEWYDPHHELSQQKRAQILKNMPQSNQTINLTHPKERFLYIAPLNTYGKIIHATTRFFLTRKPHLLEQYQPIATHPKLSRSLINLSGATHSLYDPFCGIGGLLLEAKYMNIAAIGSDIDPSKIKMAQQNTRLQSLFVCDAREAPKQNDIIVTDVPYGKNTKKVDPTLYLEFLNHAYTIADTVSICFAHWLKPSQIIAQTKWVVSFHATWYVHKSLTREIFVLKKSNMLK